MCWYFPGKVPIERLHRRHALRHKKFLEDNLPKIYMAAAQISQFSFTLLAEKAN